MKGMVFDRDRLAAALEAADDKIAEEVFEPGSQMGGESLEEFSRRYWLARADAALAELGLADTASDPPSVALYVAWTKEDGWEWDMRPFTVRTNFQEDGSHDEVQAEAVMYAPLATEGADDA